MSLRIKEDQLHQILESAANEVILETTQTSPQVKKRFSSLKRETMLNVSSFEPKIMENIIDGINMKELIKDMN